MALPKALEGKLRLPLIGAPLFIVSNPKLVTEQCKAGIVGSFPALNARPQSLLDEWLTEIKDSLAQYKGENPDQPVAPYAVNQIVHASNNRLMDDVETCIKHQVPIIITSLRPPSPEVIEAVHSYGGLVFHDIITHRHAMKSIEAGVDGVIAVCNGAGGHAGTMSPFALVKEIRKDWDGTIILSGSMSRGDDVLAAQAMGADLAYIGTRFIATEEADATQGYKDMIVESTADDIVYTPYFTGVAGSYLKGSIVNSGLDPDNLPEVDKTKMNFASDGSSSKKAWRDIWGAGQGVGTIDEILPARDAVLRMEEEYRAAKARLGA